MQLRNHRDLYAGLMFAGFGVAGTLLSQDYVVGTASEMGPGYFPLMLGVILIVLGVAIAARAFADSAPALRLAPFVWQPLVYILGSVALFALALPSLGFAIALFLLLAVSSLAGQEWRPRDIVGIYLVMFALTYLVFIKGLSIPFSTWPTALVR